jgi:hypothetical protein
LTALDPGALPGYARLGRKAPGTEKYAVDPKRLKHSLEPLWVREVARLGRTSSERVLASIIFSLRD